MVPPDKGLRCGQHAPGPHSVDIPISDVRTAIVYGTETDETAAHPDLATRFDFDYYSGTVAHRFCAQAVAGYPVTVYGKGQQRKPFISLTDAVEGLARLGTANPPADLTVYNQVTRPISIVEIADTIADVGADHGLDIIVAHFDNPREENESHQLEIENDRYMALIGEQRQSFRKAVSGILKTLLELTMYEETALRELLTLARTTAPDLASATGIPKARIYGVLESLAEDGYVKVIPAIPK